MHNKSGYMVKMYNLFRAGFQSDQAQAVVCSVKQNRL